MVMVGCGSKDNITRCDVSEGTAESNATGSDEYKAVGIHHVISEGGDAEVKL